MTIAEAMEWIQSCVYDYESARWASRVAKYVAGLVGPVDGDTADSLEKLRVLLEAGPINFEEDVCTEAEALRSTIYDSFVILLHDREQFHKGHQICS